MINISYLPDQISEYTTECMCVCACEVVLGGKIVSFVLFTLLTRKTVIYQVLVILLKRFAVILKPAR